MVDVWLPGATIVPGRNAGYASGQSSMERVVAHYTVGFDSRAVGADGYFHWLVHRDAGREGGCTQYAEADAITWHAADQGNPYGPGIEFERMTTGGVNAEGLSNAEPLTANQIEWGSRLVGFLAEWGIPATLYGGPRYEQWGFRGWVNHQAIDSSRSDGLLVAEWDAISTGDVSAGAGGGGAPGAPPWPGRLLAQPPIMVGGDVSTWQGADGSAGMVDRRRRRVRAGERGDLLAVPSREGSPRRRDRRARDVGRRVERADHLTGV